MKKIAGRSRTQSDSLPALWCREGAIENAQAKAATSCPRIHHLPKTWWPKTWWPKTWWARFRRPVTWPPHTRSRVRWTYASRVHRFLGPPATFLCLRPRGDLRLLPENRSESGPQFYITTHCSHLLSWSEFVLVGNFFRQFCNPLLHIKDNLS